MEKLKDFLHRKDIEISVKRYGIDALGAMAQGLFASLLIGTIISTLGEQLGIGILVTVGGYAKGATGAAMAISIGVALQCPPLVLFSLAAVGMAANELGGAGGPLAVLVVTIFAAEFGKLVSKETKIDLTNDERLKKLDTQLDNIKELETSYDLQRNNVENYVTDLEQFYLKDKEYVLQPFFDEFNKFMNKISEVLKKDFKYPIEVKDRTDAFSYYKIGLLDNKAFFEYFEKDMPDFVIRPNNSFKLFSLDVAASNNLFHIIENWGIIKNDILTALEKEAEEKQQSLIEANDKLNCKSENLQELIDKCNNLENNKDYFHIYEKDITMNKHNHMNIETKIIAAIESVKNSQEDEIKFTLMSDYLNGEPVCDYVFKDFAIDYSNNHYLPVNVNTVEKHILDESYTDIINKMDKNLDILLSPENFIEIDEKQEDYER